MLRAPTINTREGKRVIKQCLSGDYIPGLIYVPDFISEDEEIGIKEELIAQSEIWRHAKIQNKRRSLQFGYHLDYGSMELYKVREEGIDEIPQCWKWIAVRLQQYMETKRGRPCKEFNQLILNEYAPNKGIPHHTDRTHCFGPVVAGLSLFSPVVIEFKEKKGKKNVAKPVLLHPRSAFIMTGSSRYEWTHSISDQKEHRFFGHTIRRGVRYSFTFRHALSASSEVLTRSTYNVVSDQAMDLEEW